MSGRSGEREGAGVVRKRLAQARAALNTPAPAPVPLESVEALCQRVLGIDIHRAKRVLGRVTS